MNFEIQRSAFDNAILMRIGDIATNQIMPSAIREELEKAITKFVQTDENCRILINQMVKEAFAGINLLEVVTKAVQAKVMESTDGKTESSNPQ